MATSTSTDPTLKAEEQRLDHRIERAQPIDAAHRVGSGPPDRLVGLDEAAVSGRVEHAGQPVAHLRCHLAGERRNRVQPRLGIRAVECDERESDLDLVPDARVCFDEDPRAQQRDVRLVERAHHLADGRQPHRGVGTRQIEAPDGNPQQPSQAVVRADPGEVVTRGCAGVLERDGIDELERRQALVGRFDDDDLLIAGANEQAILEQRGEHRTDGRVAALAQPLDDGFFVLKAGVAQRAQRREESRVLSRLRQQGRRTHDADEQQREQPPPAGRRAEPHL